jgi:hypothetical protein
LPTEYDPAQAPDAEGWLAARELDLIELVERYHEEARIRTPNPRAHYAIHVMVENQAAMAERTPVAEAIRRLMGQGLSRHDALHAVGSVLLTHMNRATATNVPVSREAYFADVRALTAESWYRDYSLDAGEDRP